MLEVYVGRCLGDVGYWGTDIRFWLRWEYRTEQGA